mmetsp:Transcript_2736/g.11252  ORF Transcript_2736/g.11252 Transcript_2736/m.11252 type:complete len:225 (+) Transcript_2736:356-1030(+)
MISIGSQAAAGFGSASLGLPNAAPTSSPAVENAKTPAVICRGSAAHAFAFVLVGIAASLAPSSTADKGSEPGPGLAPGLGPGLGSGPAPLPCSASASLTCTGSGLASSGKPRPSCSARNSATSSASPSNWASNPSETRLGGLMGTLLIAICGTVSGKKPKTVEMGATASEVPMIRMQSAFLRSPFSALLMALGSASPKKTTSGFSTPPHSRLRHCGTRPRITSA